MQKHLKLMNSKELNLAKKIKKLMFSFQGIMVFYKMPAAIFFIILLFSILKLGLFLPFWKRGITQFFNSKINKNWVIFHIKSFNEQKILCLRNWRYFFLPLVIMNDKLIPIQLNSCRFLVHNNGHKLSVIIDYIHIIILFHLYPSTIHICIMMSCTERIGMNNVTFVFRKVGWLL